MWVFDRGRCLCVGVVALLMAATLAESPGAMGSGKASPGAKVRLQVSDSARLEVKAHWGPITESEYGFHRRWEELRDLRGAHADSGILNDDVQFLLRRGQLSQSLILGIRFTLQINLQSGDFFLYLREIQYANRQAGENS